VLDNHTLLKHDSAMMHKICDAWSPIAKDSYETDYETADYYFQNPLEKKNKRLIDKVFSLGVDSECL